MSYLCGMKTKILLLALLAIVCAGCKNTRGTTKVSATGSIYECLVVCPNSMKGELEAVMGADMPCLPQMEPYFKVTQIVPSAFDDFLKSTRNILLIDISADRYTEAKAKFSKDLWSTPQVVCRLQAPDEAAALAYWKEHGDGKTVPYPNGKQKPNPLAADCQKSMPQPCHNNTAKPPPWW